MPQDPLYNKNDRNGRPRTNEDGSPAPKKGPRFSIYWIYIIILAVMLGFQFLDPFKGGTKTVSQERFLEILKVGDVNEYTVVSNRNEVRVSLKPSAVEK